MVGRIGCERVRAGAWRSDGKLLGEMVAAQKQMSGMERGAHSWSLFGSRINATCSRTKGWRERAEARASPRFWLQTLGRWWYHMLEWRRCDERAREVCLAVAGPQVQLEDLALVLMGIKDWDKGENEDAGAPEGI